MVHSSLKSLVDMVLLFGLFPHAGGKATIGALILVTSGPSLRKLLRGLRLTSIDGREYEFRLLILLTFPFNLVKITIEFLLLLDTISVLNIAVPGGLGGRHFLNGFHKTNILLLAPFSGHIIGADFDNL